jgi:hypothetical protein
MSALFPIIRDVSRKKQNKYMRDATWNDLDMLK